MHVVVCLRQNPLAARSLVFLKLGFVPHPQTSEKLTLTNCMDPHAVFANTTGDFGS
jgi:hypothetical protein